MLFDEISVNSFDLEETFGLFLPQHFDSVNHRSLALSISNRFVV